MIHRQALLWHVCICSRPRHKRVIFVQRVAIVALISCLMSPSSIGQNLIRAGGTQKVSKSVGDAITGQIPLWQGVAIVPPGTASVTVFFATNRKVTGHGADVTDYSNNSRAGLSYGACQVSIPRDRRFGDFQTPFVRILYNPAKHIVVTSTVVMTGTKFFFEMKTKLKNARGKEALVFVHGFNTSFEDSVRRTAQLAYDLKFEGAAISFSWPSYQLSWLQKVPMLVPSDTVKRAALGSSYNGAVENADLSVLTLTEFLDEVSKKTGANTIHIIAHSMGARVLTKALNNLKESPGQGARTRFRQIVLAAPDINVEIFEQLANVFRAVAERVTVYASATDEVLKVSKMVNDHPRAGEGGDQILVVPSADSIEASLVDTSLEGHSYFAENKSVLFDLFGLLRHGDPPDYRLGLEPTLTPANKRYWIIRP
jgi:esterase/lipase superfamily enzyme